MTTPRTIPELRDRLHAISIELLDYATEAEWFARDPAVCMEFAALVVERAEEIHEIADETRRRPPVRNGRTTALKVTPEIAATVRLMADAYPKMPNREIGRRCGIDGGRVSEILAGKRGEPGIQP